MGGDWLAILIMLQDKAQVHASITSITAVIIGHNRLMVLTCQCVGNMSHHTTLPWLLPIDDKSVYCIFIHFSDCRLHYGTLCCTNAHPRQCDTQCFCDN